MAILVGQKIIDGIKGIQTSAVKEKLCIAIPALIAFPTIDYFNKSVDEDTRKYSAAKSGIKVLIGALDGLFARYVGQMLGEKLVKSEFIKPISDEFKNPEKMKAFSKSVGKTSAFLVTLVSILVMDIPFIDKALNVAMKKLFPNKSEK
ncbi:MAG: hypothetical protein A2287_01095 [Candidatus Melainabacteria bacterium RIFOXYA12_FULL_32_12]|nr:MAG: hypothetical protein A2287_01095 [Candidatus Melainabacteria bacterium RIFOXYA12_FULL_32_12]